MRRLIISVIASFLFLSGLAGCKTVGAIKEDFNNITSRSSGEPTKSVVAPSDRRQLVLEVQNMLADKGYDPGPVDGQAGPSTTSALRSFQAARGLTVTYGVTREAYIQLASDNGSVSANQHSQEDSRECVRNFSKGGGIRNYRTYVTLNGVSQDLATQRLLRMLGRKGYVINENDVSRGYINASFVTGSGSTQFTALIDKGNGGSNVELNVAATGAGLLSTLLIPGNAYKNELCEYIGAMQAGA
jgi:peptidoglycan hydrolase-like protein with peptidoglycan-binding domain